MKNFGLNSEYGRLSAVLLFKPGIELNNHPDPISIDHLRPIDYEKFSWEFDQIVKTYSALGIKVFLIDGSPLNDDRRYLYNMMYCRDLLFMTPKGAIIGNMARNLRQQEVLYAEKTLKSLNIPVLKQISSPGTFEGADALWVKKNLVAIGVGNRTNEEAFQQIKKILATMNVDCVSLPSYQTKTQHLLGTVQFVDKDIVLVRSEIADKEITNFLKSYHYTVVNVPENNEVRTKQAMNIVTVEPGKIIMTAGCPETKALFLHAGLTIAAELELAQLINGAGGLACATGIIARGDI